MTRPYRAIRGAMRVVRDFPGPSVNVVVASFCNMLSPVLDVSFQRMAAAELALPSLAPPLVETVIQAFAVAAQISDPYLCAGGELSSSARAIHPGETPTSKRICGAASRP